MALKCFCVICLTGLVLKLKTMCILVFNMGYFILISQRSPPVTVLDLFNEFRDGSRLLDLLEVMSGQRMVSV